MDEGSKGGKTPTSKEQGLFLLVLLSTRKRLGRSLSTEMRSGFVPGLSAPFNPMVIILLETRGHWQGSGFLLLLFSPPGSGHRSFEQSGPSRGGPISSSLGVVPTWGGTLSSPLPASKAALSRVQTELSCLCLQIVMSLGGNPRESQAAPIPILGPVNPPVPDAFEAPAGDLCRLKQSSRREGRWLSR